MRLTDLFEGRDAPLYHGTGLWNAMEIVTHDEIAAKTSQGGLPGQTNVVYGVSLSRDPRQAARFGAIIFELDQRKLVHRHRLVPHDYWGRSAEVKREIKQRRHDGDETAEAEEFVYGSIRDLSRYLTAIWMTPRVREKVEVRSTESGWERLQQLLGHPKLRIGDPGRA